MDGVNNQAWAILDHNSVFGVGDAGVQTLLGDANNDGLVSGADLIAVQQNFGQAGPPNDGTLPGDANDDGLVSGADLIAVQQNFGKALGPGTAVPEPAALTVIVCLAATSRRRVVF